MRYALVVMMAFLPVSALAAPGSGVDTSGATYCEVHGYLTDKDPKGTNVRSGPSATAPIAGHLLPSYSQAGSDEDYAVEFTIIGSKNGWMLIRDAKTGQYGDGSEKIVYAGPGWISGGLIGFTVGSTAMRSGPEKTDKQIATLLDSAKGYGPDSYIVQRVHACRGSAVEITAVISPSIEPKATPVRGWVRHVCSNQVTTCDAGGD